MRKEGERQGCIRGGRVLPGRGCKDPRKTPAGARQNLKRYRARTWDIRFSYLSMTKFPVITCCGMGTYAERPSARTPSRTPGVTKLTLRNVLTRSQLRHSTGILSRLTKGMTKFGGPVFPGPEAAASPGATGPLFASWFPSSCLGTHGREAPLRMSGKQSFQEVRSQAELGNEESKPPGPCAREAPRLLIPHPFVNSRGRRNT
jgi:hypothetical protein